MPSHRYTVYSSVKRTRGKVVLPPGNLFSSFALHLLELPTYMHRVVHFFYDLMGHFTINLFNYHVSTILIMKKGDLLVQK